MSMSIASAEAATWSALFGREERIRGSHCRAALGTLTCGPVATISMNRLALFELDGRLVCEIVLPGAHLVPAAPVGKTILACHFAGGSRTTSRPMWHRVEVVWERQGIREIADTECGRIASGVASPAGGWTFPVCQREFVFRVFRLLGLLRLVVPTWARTDSRPSTPVSMPSFVTNVRVPRIPRRLARVMLAVTRLDVRSLSMQATKARTSGTPTSWTKSSHIPSSIHSSVLINP